MPMMNPQMVIAPLIKACSEAFVIPTLCTVSRFGYINWVDDTHSSRILCK
jgi:hypothetical protein